MNVMAYDFHLKYFAVWQREITNILDTNDKEIEDTKKNQVEILELKNINEI